MTHQLAAGLVYITWAHTEAFWVDFCDSSLLVSGHLFLVPPLVLTDLLSHFSYFFFLGVTLAFFLLSLHLLSPFLVSIST